MQTQSNKGLSRRQFLQTSSAAMAATAAVAVPLVNTARAAEEMPIKIGLIGCGGRGTGATLDALGAATKVIYPKAGYHTEDVAQGAAVEHKNIQVVALADLLPDRLDNCRQQLAKLGISIAKDLCFTGFEAYKKLLAVAEVNYVILATPPHFRPLHLQAAVEAGKHVFMEKPGAVDAPGVHTMIAAGELAKKKGLAIGAGTQRRHMKAIRKPSAAFATARSASSLYGCCYWDGWEIWVIRRQSGWSDMEWQLRNWPYFTWLSGDHIVEQHVHNLDIMNWVMGTHPSGDLGPGGPAGRVAAGIRPHLRPFRRRVRVSRRRADVQPVPADQRLRCDSSARRWWAPRAQRLQGTHPAQEGSAWRTAASEDKPLPQEHEDLIAGIRGGNPVNEAQAVAESTLTAIIGREAVYSGRADQRGTRR